MLPRRKAKSRGSGGIWQKAAPGAGGLAGRRACGPRAHGAAPGPPPRHLCRTPAPLRPPGTGRWTTWSWLRPSPRSISVTGRLTGTGWLEPWISRVASSSWPGSFSAVSVSQVTVYLALWARAWCESRWWFLTKRRSGFPGRCRSRECCSGPAWPGAGSTGTSGCRGAAAADCPPGDSAASSAG